MEHRHTRLAEGIELLYTGAELFKTGLLNVTLTVPLREETAAATALIPEVLYRGTRKYPDMEQLSAAEDSLYGASVSAEVRQRGESQCIDLACGFIDDCYALDGTAVLEPAAELLAGILLDPVTENGVFLRAYVEAERENLADRIRSRINNKQNWAIFRTLQEMCADEAFGVDKLGSEKQALSITPEQLWARYQTVLREARVTIYYCGGAEYGRVEDAVRRFFAPLLTGRDGPVEWDVRPAPAGPVKEVTDRLDVTQGQLVLGFRTGGVALGHPDYPALLVMNALYGGTAHSKLFMNVRERMSLCYYATSMLDRAKGLMVVSSGLEFGDYGRAREEILAQLEAVRKGDFTGEELNAALRSVANQLRSRRESQWRMGDDQVTMSLAGMEQTADEALLEQVERVTAEQVSAVARGVRLDTVYRLTGKEGR